MMGVTSIKKAKNPSLSRATVIKRGGCVKVRTPERQKTAGRLVSSSSVGVLAK